MLHWRRIKVYARSVWDVIIIITAFCLANDGHLLFSAQWLQKPLRGSWWEVLTRGWLIYCPPLHTHTLPHPQHTHPSPPLSAQAFGFACATPFPIPSVSSVFLSKFKLCLFPSSYIPTLNLHMFSAPLLHSLYSRTSCNLASYGICWTSMEKAWVLEDTRKQPTESRTVPMYLNCLNIIAPDCSNFSIQTSFVHCEVQTLCRSFVPLFSESENKKFDFASYIGYKIYILGNRFWV